MNLEKQRRKYFIQHIYGYMDETSGKGLLRQPERKLLPPLHGLSN